MDYMFYALRNHINIIITFKRNHLLAHSLYPLAGPKVTNLYCRLVHVYQDVI